MKKRILGVILSSVALVLTVGVAFAKHQETSEVKAASYSQTIDQYYGSFNWNQEGATLKTALFNKIKITTAGWSYDGLWTAYKTTDVRPDGTHFWDIYSDSTDYTLNDKRINASYKKEGDSINREHVIPQSTFNEAAPMKSDIHHVLPSDGYVNNRRSAYPHGNVTGSPTYTSNDGCKLGSGTGSTTVFEPMDQYKGDIARIYFYFVTCYQDKMSSNSFSVFDKSTFPSIKSAYLNVYLQWHKQDPVSQKEIDRNNAAYAGQGNRNPFIDCPYAVGAIWDTENKSSYGNPGEYTSGEGVTISKSSASLISGNTTTISATSTNSSTISWTTSNSSVVSLSSSSSASGNNITLTANSAGDATVTAKATISGKQYSKTCSVHVSSTKQVSSIAISGQKTAYSIDDEFEKPTVTATYNDGTNAVVTNSATFTGYNMSTPGDQTVTVSYSYGGETATTTYEIYVQTSGGSSDINDYTISNSALTSAGINNGMKVVWGTNTSTLAESIGSDWVYLSSTSSSWLIFTIEGTSSGFKLKSGNNYVYCSGNKKVAFSTNQSTLFTLTAGNLVTNGTSGTFYFNNTGLRPYTSGSYTSAYLYKLSPNLDSIGVEDSPDKMAYEVGECFNPAGLVIYREYTDGSTDTYAYNGHASEFSFNPSTLTPLTASDDTIEITYGSKTCDLDINVVVPKTTTSISISGYTTAFVEGDTFSFGGTVTANYDDSTTGDVTSSASFTGYDMTIVGNQTVTVSYGGKSQTYGITVSMGTLSSIAVSGQTTEYEKNESFSFDGTCTATFANGYQKAVTPTSVTSPDMTTGGDKTVTVSYTYNGKTKTTSYQITVNAYRTVIEVSDVDGNITWPESSEAKVVCVSETTVTNIQNTYYENSSLRLGTGSGGGQIRIESDATIKSLRITAKAYASNRTGTLTVGDRSINVTNYEDYVQFNLLTLQNPTDSLVISTASSSVRINIQSISFNGEDSVDIGKTEDCVGLETFISNYMHMDYTENLGYCKDDVHHYYSTAKSAFNALNNHQRSLFTGNSAYSLEWERLSTWAAKNGDSLNTTTNTLASVRINNIVINTNNSDAILYILMAMSLIGVMSFGGYTFLKRKKHKEE